MSSALYSYSTQYRYIVGALQYFTFIRPNICYVVNKVCQFMHAPIEVYRAVVKFILGYFQATTLYGLHITQGSSLSLHDFTNADRASDVDVHKSTGGYLWYLGYSCFMEI